MRLLLRFAPLLVGLFVAVPAFAEITSAPQFAIDPISSGPTTESVELRTLVFQLGGTCPEAGTPQCIKTRISFRITPCPPGAACTNGGYEETYYPETSHARYFTLNRGQEYTFTGHVISDVSARPNLTCSNIIRCTFEQDVLTKKYPQQAAPEVAAGQASELAVDLREELVERLLAAATPPLQELSDVRT